MTAGRGVTHAERTPVHERETNTRIHGIQSWVALPAEHECCDPDFVHYPATGRPRIDVDGVSMRLIAGSAFGHQAPVPTLSDLFYLEADFTAGAALELPLELGERAVYVVSGSVRIGSTDYSDGRMLVLKPGTDVIVAAPQETKLMLLGGQPIDGERHIWWNFVATSTDRIEAAKALWRNREFPPVPGDPEFMAMPEQ